MVRASLGVALLAVGLGGVVGPAWGQGAKWNNTVEANANLLFGAAKGRVAAFLANTSRADSTVEFRAEMRFSYADAPNDEEVVKVTARSSRFSLSLDYRPYDRFSPFYFGSAEASLQQRVAHRYASGGGAKLRLIPPGDNRLDLSLALLWEETRALNPAPDKRATVTLARWSLRLRADRRLSSAVTMSHQTLWQPAAKALNSYTTETQTGLAVALNSALSTTVTLRDRYDSAAITRGALSNHDGQLLFGIRARF